MAEAYWYKQFGNFVNSLLHNSGVVIVGFGVAFLDVTEDSLQGLREFSSLLLPIGRFGQRRNS